MTSFWHRAGRMKVLDVACVRIGRRYLRLDVPRAMGIVNVTPDSFSGDGFGDDTSAAVARGLEMFKQGADIVDVGGESTRPGALPVSIQEEISRVCPVIERLNRKHPGFISVDTMKPEVAEAAIVAGAGIVNDVSGLRNRAMIDLVSDTGSSIIIMHMLGEPRTMQKNPRYEDVVRDVGRFLRGRIRAAEDSGIRPDRIMIDPGIGFGKTLNHNLELLGRLRELRSIGKPIVVGVSRKSFIGKLTGTDADSRLEGSIAAVVLAIREGASIVRVHDVAETVRALRVADGIMKMTRIP